MLPFCAASQTVANIQPSVIQFDMAWCPRTDEVVEMTKLMTLFRVGCCIQSAILSPTTVASPELLEKWRKRIATENTFGKECTGIALPEPEQLKVDESREAAKRAETSRAADQFIDETMARRREAPTILRKLNMPDFCRAYGQGLRNQEVPEVGQVDMLSELVVKEAARRGVRFNKEMVLKQRIQIGITECELFASFGEPKEQNRTVSSSSVRVQNVYGSRWYVYTVNGRVSGWQD
jgi:hypothetical protein